jgi:hypothetical protein
MLYRRGGVVQYIAVNVRLRFMQERVNNQSESGDYQRARGVSKSMYYECDTEFKYDTCDTEIGTKGVGVFLLEDLFTLNTKS